MQSVNDTVSALDALMSSSVAMPPPPPPLRQRPAIPLAPPGQRRLSGSVAAAPSHPIYSSFGDSGAAVAPQQAFGAGGSFRISGAAALLLSRLPSSHSSRSASHVPPLPPSFDFAAADGSRNCSFALPPSPTSPNTTTTATGRGLIVNASSPPSSSSAVPPLPTFALPMTTAAATSQAPGNTAVRTLTPPPPSNGAIVSPPLPAMSQQQADDAHHDGMHDKMSGRGIDATTEARRGRYPADDPLTMVSAEEEEEDVKATGDGNANYIPSMFAAHRYDCASPHSATGAAGTPSPPSFDDNAFGAIGSGRYRGDTMPPQNDTSEGEGGGEEEEEEVRGPLRPESQNNLAYPREDATYPIHHQPQQPPSPSSDSDYDGDGLEAAAQAEAHVRSEWSSMADKAREYFSVQCKGGASRVRMEWAKAAEEAKYLSTPSQRVMADGGGRTVMMMSRSSDEGRGGKGTHNTDGAARRGSTIPLHPSRGGGGQSREGDDFTTFSHHRPDARKGDVTVVTAPPPSASSKALFAFTINPSAMAGGKHTSNHQACHPPIGTGVGDPSYSHRHSTGMPSTPSRQKSAGQQSSPYSYHASSTSPSPSSSLAGRKHSRPPLPPQRTKSDIVERGLMSAREREARKREDVMLKREQEERFRHSPIVVDRHPTLRANAVVDESNADEEMYHQFSPDNSLLPSIAAFPHIGKGNGKTSSTPSAATTAAAVVRPPTFSLRDVLRNGGANTNDHADDDDDDDDHDADGSSIGGSSSSALAPMMASAPPPPPSQKHAPRWKEASIVEPSPSPPSRFTVHDSLRPRLQPSASPITIMPDDKKKQHQTHDHQHQQQEQAATCIQRHVRGMLTRMHMWLWFNVMGAAASDRSLDDELNAMRREWVDGAVYAVDTRLREKEERALRYLAKEEEKRAKCAAVNARREALLSAHRAKEAAPAVAEAHYTQRARVIQKSIVGAREALKEEENAYRRDLQGSPTYRGTLGGGGNGAAQQRRSIADEDSDGDEDDDDFVTFSDRRADLQQQWLDDHQSRTRERWRREHWNPHDALSPTRDLQRHHHNDHHHRNYHNDPHSPPLPNGKGFSAANGPYLSPSPAGGRGGAGPPHYYYSEPNSSAIRDDSSHLTSHYHQSQSHPFLNPYSGAASAQTIGGEALPAAFAPLPLPSGANNHVGASLNDGGLAACEKKAPDASSAGIAAAMVGVGNASVNHPSGEAPTGNRPSFAVAQFDLGNSSAQLKTPPSSSMPPPPNTLVGKTHSLSPQSALLNML